MSGPIPRAPRSFVGVVADDALWGHRYRPIGFRTPDRGKEMAATRRKTDEVLASTRNDLEAQLDAVRNELARLTAEERLLAKALKSLERVQASK